MSNPSSNVREPTIGMKRERDITARADNLAASVINRLAKLKKPPTLAILREIITNDAARHFRLLARVP